MENIVVYASKSDNCLTLLKLMDSCGILKLFRLVDICYNPIPFGIQNIPVLIIKNLPKMLVGEEAFKWVDQTRRWTETQRIMSSNIQDWHKIGSRLSVAEPSSDTKLLVYDESSMASTSDKYCLVDETKNAALPQNYVGAEEKILIWAPPNAESEKLFKQRADGLLSKITEIRTSQDKITKDNNDSIIDKAKSGQLLMAPLISSK